MPIWIFTTGVVLRLLLTGTGTLLTAGTGPVLAYRCVICRQKKNTYIAFNRIPLTRWHAKFNRKFTTGAVPRQY